MLEKYIYNITNISISSNNLFLTNYENKIQLYVAHIGKWSIWKFRNNKLFQNNEIPIKSIFLF